MATWQDFCNNPTEHNYRRLTDPRDREAARRYLHGPNASERRQGQSRQRAINATPQSEIDRHCQTEFLS